MGPTSNTTLLPRTDSKAPLPDIMAMKTEDTLVDSRPGLRCSLRRPRMVATRISPQPDHHRRRYDYGWMVFVVVCRRWSDMGSVEDKLLQVHCGALN